MGGLNSGRRPELWDPRGQVEDALILDAGTLARSHGFVVGTQGTITFANGSQVAFSSDGERLTLNYAKRGQPYCQHVRLSAIPLNWRRWHSQRPALLCECGYRGYKLYLSKRQPYFLCRKCQGLIYEIQTYNSRGMCHALMQSIMEERRSYAAWQKHDNKRRLR